MSIIKTSIHKYLYHAAFEADRNINMFGYYSLCIMSMSVKLNDTNRVPLRCLNSISKAITTTVNNIGDIR